MTKPNTIEVPARGIYVEAGGAQYHITIDGGLLSIRCRDGGDAASGERIFTHMPAGNQVLIETH